MNSKIDQQKQLVHRTSPLPEQKHKHLKEKKKISIFSFSLRCLCFFSGEGDVFVQGKGWQKKILPQDQKEKSEHRESSRLRSQPRKNYKTFIPQSKILKKVEFLKKLSFLFFIIFFLTILNIHIFKIICWKTLK